MSYAISIFISSMQIEKIMKRIKGKVQGISKTNVLIQTIFRRIATLSWHKQINMQKNSVINIFTR